MRVTTTNTNTILNPKIFIEGLIISNPVSQSTTISFSLFQSEKINVTIYDITGKLIKDLFNGILNKGEHQLKWDVNGDKVKSGVYFLKVTGDNFSRSCKLVVVK
jgi:flagellar hook assembly protein FlgD